MKIPRLIMVTGLIFLGGLAFLSVYGAFLGAERAAQFFQSPPLALFWIILIGILFGGFLYFPRLWTRPFLFMIHAGCLLVLLGGLWGSEQGIGFRNHLTKTLALYKGMIPFYEGEGSSVVYDSQGSPIGSLPFEIRLQEFEVQYYDGPKFVVRDRLNPNRWVTVPVELGTAFPLGEGIQFRAMHAFRNLQIQIQGQNRAAVEGPQEGDNPGYEVLLQMSDGGHEIQYVFERRAVHSLPRYRFEIFFQPPQVPKEYISELFVMENGQEKVRKRIEVNHPLSYKGYLFHQKSWGQDSRGVYSVIGVVSNSGVLAVFAGYGLLVAGLIGQLWIAPATGMIRRKQDPA